VTGRPTDVELADQLREVLRPLGAEIVEQELDRRERRPTVEWLTVEEAAAQRRTTPGALRARCERRQVAGAVRDGRRWLIPSLDTAPGQATLTQPIRRGERRENGPAPGTRRY
jgi:hypothetical protein